MLRSLIFATPAALALPMGSPFAQAPAAPMRKADLADRVAGTYQGDIISDARGSSKNGVTIIVTRVGPNKVAIKSSHARIPAATIPLALRDLAASGQLQSGDRIVLAAVGAGLTAASCLVTWA